MMKVNLEFLTSPLVKYKQMQNVQHHIFGHFLMHAVIPKLPTFPKNSTLCRFKILFLRALFNLQPLWNNSLSFVLITVEH